MKLFREVLILTKYFVLCILRAEKLSHLNAFRLPLSSLLHLLFLHSFILHPEHLVSCVSPLLDSLLLSNRLVFRFVEVVPKSEHQAELLQIQVFQVERLGVP